MALWLAACSSEQAVGNSGDEDPAAPPAPPGWSVEPAGLGPCAEADGLPALAGEWLVGCAPDGSWRAEGPDRAVTLDTPEGPVALADGVLVTVGFGGFRQRFGEAAEPLPYASPELVAPPVTDGKRLALAYADHVETFTLGDTRRAHVPARPVPGEPVALWEGRAVWVERGDGLDLRAGDAAHAPVTLAGGPGDQRLPVADGPTLAWVDRGAVRTREGVEDRDFAAETGFAAPPALGGGRLCWEDRGGWRARGGALDDALGVAIRCADGSTLDAAGDDLAPRVGAAGVLWTHAGRSWLARPAGGGS